MYASEFGATNIMMRKFTKMEINADIQLTLSASLSEKKPHEQRNNDCKQRLLVKAGTMY